MGPVVVAALLSVALVPQLKLEPSEQFSVQSRAFVEVHTEPWREPALLGRGFAFGYSLDGRRTLLKVRAGYRFGLPLDEAAPVGDDSLVLTSGGTLSVRAGTVAWFTFAFDGFREVAGARVVQLDAVPGLRVQPFRDAPVDVGAGCLASFRRAPGEASYARSFAALFQLSGRF